jgi:hypothetical protein
MSPLRVNCPPLMLVAPLKKAWNFVKKATHASSFLGEWAGSALTFRSEVKAQVSVIQRCCRRSGGLLMAWGFVREGFGCLFIR